MNTELELSLEDDQRIEALLRGASSRLADVLDPSVPGFESNPGRSAAEPADHIPLTITSELSRRKANRNRNRWIGSAAALALCGVGGAVLLNNSVNQAAIKTFNPTESTITKPNQDASPFETAAAAETTAAAETEAAAAEIEAAAETAAAAAPAITPPIEVSPNLDIRTLPKDDKLYVDRSRSIPQATVPPVTTPVVPSVDTYTDNQSTFGLDVDTGSYSRLRDLLRSGAPVDPNDVRTEELINAFEQDYPNPDDTFGIYVDGAQVPFLPDTTRVVRVGVAAKKIANDDRQKSNLTFVIDVSGSMEDDGKLEMVKTSLITLVDHLRDSEKVAIVAFSDDARLVLPATEVKNRDQIVSAIATLVPTNGTNAEAGLVLGYNMARTSFDAGRNNKVILASDGVANVGPTGPDEILRTIKEQAGKRIGLITVGVGQGTYNDPMMERLADGGDGFYTYIDSPEQAQKVFGEKLTGSLQTVANDAKAQVTFDPSKVKAYRLLGYENRNIADNQFRNDSVDAGEIGSGHTVTAIYVVELYGGASGDLATVDLRWTEPGRTIAREMRRPIHLKDVDREFNTAKPRLQQDIYIAAWAEALRGGPWGGRASLSELAQRAPRLRAVISDDLQVGELVELIQRTAGYSDNRQVQPLSPPTTVYIPVIQSPTTIPW